MRVERTLTLRRPRELLYGIAADVESYPAFLKGFRVARIVARSGDQASAVQTLALGPLTLTFDTQARFQAPDWIRITSRDPVFERFALEWRFAPAPDGATTISVVADLKLRSGLADRLCALALPALVADTVRSYALRVAQLAGSVPADPR